MADFYKFNSDGKREEAVWIVRVPARRAGKAQMIREVLAAAHMHSLREPLGPRPEPEAARVRNDERDKVLQRVIEQAEQWARTKKEKEKDKYERNGRPLTIAVDFDGTLCDNKWPEIGAEHWSAIRWCQAAKAGGAKLILWTNRAGERLREAVAWCEAHGLRFDAVNENLPEIIKAFGGDTRKIVADIYLDDKALAAETVEQVMRGIPAQE